MGKTNQELFDELLAKKHNEVRAELTKPASLASVDFEVDMLVRVESPDGMPRCIELYADPVCPPGTIFGIDRASPQNRLKGATVESATKVLQELWPDFAENYEATKHELRTTTPGYNFKPILTDEDKERTMHKARENRFNRDEPERRERVKNYDAPKHAVCIDALGFEKIEKCNSCFASCIMMMRPIESALDRKFALPGPNTPMPRIERVEFQLTHEQERRVVDGVEQYVRVYREVVSAKKQAPPPTAREWTYTADQVAYALFCRDPEIVALVERVSDVGPAGRGCIDFNKTVELHKARAEKMLPFFKKAWDRGQGDVSKGTLEGRACEQARRQAVLLIGDLARM